ncbi:MAG: hypothetical protein WAT39_08475 [Planctomycetota bacterium]
MFARFVLSLIAVGVAVGLTWSTSPCRVQACTEPDPLADTDDDFLPDCVEWAVLTSAASGDTDGDTIPDFVEVVQRGAPRHPGFPVPADQEMRVVITGPSAASPGAPTWLHLLLRTVEPGTPMTSFNAWLEMPALPGLQLPIDILALGGVQFRTRFAGPEGSWIMISAQMVSPAVLQMLLPCSFHVESVLGGRHLRSVVKLFDVQGTIVSLVPFDDRHFAAQSISAVQDGSGLSNRVCVLDLEEVGSGLGGVVYRVNNAFCDDCNEVECAPSCPQSIGWLLTIPGGLSGVTGND